MVIDTSALIALLLNEPAAERIARAIDSARVRLLSAANLLEASIEIESRKGEPAARELDLLLYRARIDVIPVDQDQAEIARAAWRRFGDGRHTGGLTYGDCFAYALAAQRRLPLLFAGGDFTRTDIAPAIVASRS